MVMDRMDHNVIDEIDLSLDTGLIYLMTKMVDMNYHLQKSLRFYYMFQCLTQDLPIISVSNDTYA